MKNIIKISFVSILFALVIAPPAFAVNNYAVSGLCVGQSSNYGNSFFDVSAGTANINGSNYNMESVVGLLAENNSVIEVYAYRNPQTNKVTVKTLVNGTSFSFKDSSVSIGKVYTGSEALKKGSSATKFESYVPGCTGYVALSVYNQSSSILALNDTINTSSKLNVRSNPSTSSGVLGTVELGATGVVVSGPVSSGTYDWWKIQYSSGLSGWSAGDWLSKDASSGPSYAVETPTTNTEIGQVDTSEASVEQMASMLESAKALLNELETILKNSLR